MSAINQLTAVASSNKWRIVWTFNTSDASNGTTVCNLKIFNPPPNGRLIFQSWATGLSFEDSRLKAARTITNELYRFINHPIGHNILNKGALRHPPSGDHTAMQAVHDANYLINLQEWCEAHGFTLLPINNQIGEYSVLSTISVVRHGIDGIVGESVFERSAEQKSVCEADSLASYNMFNFLADIHDLTSRPLPIEEGTLVITAPQLVINPFIAPNPANIRPSVIQHTSHLRTLLTLGREASSVVDNRRTHRPLRTEMRRSGIVITNASSSEEEVEQLPFY